jgi:hypothetical protein
METEPTFETSRILNAPKTIGNTQHNIYTMNALLSQTCTGSNRVLSFSISAIQSTFHDRLCDLVVRVPSYRTEMYCVSCEVRTEFIYVM